MSEFKPILIADPDLEYYDKFKEDPLWGKVPIIVVETGGEAQGLIKENKGDFSCVVISPDCVIPEGLSVVSFSLKYQPAIPILLLTSLQHSISEEFDPARVGVSDILAKPFDLEKLLKVTGVGTFFDAQKALEIAKQFKDKVDQEVVGESDAFIAIKADQFVSGKDSLFDVYVRLRVNKYIKILQAGDHFDPKKITDYLEKGVQYFFIRKEAQESYLNYCEKMANILIKSDKVDTNKKFGQLFNQAEVIMDTLCELGVDNESIVYAQKYTKTVLNFIGNVAEKDDYLSNMMKELSRFEHSCSVVLIASMLSREAGLETDKNMEVLGSAAFLHDVGLIKEADADDMYSDGREKYFNEQDIIDKLESKQVFGDEKKFLEGLWETHPLKGSKMVGKIKGIPSIVPQIISQHHAIEFKEKGLYKGAAIHPLAEIVEISDQFVRLMTRFSNKDANKKQIISELLDRVNSFPFRTREPFGIVFKLYKDDKKTA
ncbi:HD domain-containing protein [Bacteriovoracaceae bacterium]|nr:HD domain-containing protein [Bacteriovoracaceae bacterium]